MTTTRRDFLRGLFSPAKGNQARGAAGSVSAVDGAPVRPEISDDKAQRALEALGNPKAPAHIARPGYLETLLRAAPCDGALPPRRANLPFIRPPGAVHETLFAQRCDGCGDCARACPHQAIVPLDPRHGSAAGTPTIVAKEAPCLMCEDMPCVRACGRGALLPIDPQPAGREPATTYRRGRIAVAEVRQFDCLAYNGTFCSACAERCPEPGAIVTAGGRPRIDTARCTGCGQCQYVCPAPRNAILVVAAPERFSVDEPSTRSTSER